MKPELIAVRLADPSERWERLGFSARDSELAMGGIRLQLGAAGSGIVEWTLAGIDPRTDIDGLATRVVEPVRTPDMVHENGAVGIDHVVVTSPSFDRTVGELEAIGMPLKRTITAPKGNRMGFRRLGPAILELVEVPGAPAGPARFWGLVVIVADLDALAARLGDHLGSIRDAVQPGRRIATLRDSAGLGEAVAFMTA